MDYINKDYYSSLKKSDRRYINITPDTIGKFTAALEGENIHYSAMAGAYKATVTVSAEDYERAKAIYGGVQKTPPRTEIIGNTEYRTIRNRNYINTSGATAKEISKLLAGNSDIRFSGIIRGDGSAVITADGERNAAHIRGMIDNIENSELYEALESMGFSRIADGRNGFINVMKESTGETVGFENADALRAAIADPAYSDFFHSDNFGAAAREDDNKSFDINEEDDPDYFEILEQTVNEAADEYAKDSEQLVSVTDEITKKEAELTELVNKKEYEKVAVLASELTELGKKSAELKKKIQAEEITVSDVQDLRSIQPARKSVQNMLDREVAQTPKFEKLLGEEMGEKSAYEMRVSDNEWRNDNSKTVPIIQIQNRPMPKKLSVLRKSYNKINFPNGLFVNKDTGIAIHFGSTGLDETIAKTIQDNQHKIPIEARVCALYQMPELIENSVCFDSNIGIAKKNSPNSLFFHKMYGVIKYNNELYLTKLSVEETYKADMENRLQETSKRLYCIRDIKISPMTPGDQTRFSSLQNSSVNGVSISDTIISIPQLYDLVKTYDQDFFENPSAVGRADREAEITAHEEFSKAMEDYLKVQEPNENIVDAPEAVQTSEALSGETFEPEQEKQQGKFKIYQLPGGEQYHGIRFEGMEQLQKDGVKLNHDDYELVYEGKLADFKGNATLEAIFAQFNTDRPADFTGHSLSVSDVVVIETEDNQTAYYCDTAGFAEMPEFFLEKEISQEKSALEINPPKREDVPLEHSENTFSDKLQSTAQQVQTETLTSPKQTSEALSGETQAAEHNSIHFGLLGNGITAYDISRTDKETNDYLTVAHISPEGVIKIYDDSLSAEDMERINEQAQSAREKFMTDWNMLSPEQQFQKLLDRADISTTVNINHEKLSMEQKVEKYMPFVFFGEGERPEPQFSLNVGDVIRIAPDKENPDDLPERYGVVERVSDTRIEIGTYSLNDTAFCSKNGGMLYDKETFADEYEFELIGNVDELRLNDYEQNKDIYEALKNHDIIHLTEPKKEQSVEYPVENARSKKFVNLRIEYNETETDELDKGFVLKADTDRAKDLILVCYGERSPENMYRAIKSDNYSVSGIEKQQEQSHEKNEERNNQSVVADFRAKTDTLFKPMDYWKPEDIEGLVGDHVIDILQENGVQFNEDSIRAVVSGSRARGIERPDSDVDVVVEIETDEREDDLFNMLHDEPYMFPTQNFQNIPIDINPITPHETGTLETYLPQVEAYLTEKAEKAENTFSDKLQSTTEEQSNQTVNTADTSEKRGYEPKIGDLIDLNDELLSVTDISENIITFAETETLFGNFRRMDLNDFLSADFSVVEEVEEEIAEADIIPDVPVEHQEEIEELSAAPEQTAEEANEPETSEKENVPVEHHNFNTDNFVITDENFGEATPKARYKANIEAIKTLNIIESEQRTASPDEQRILSGYTGWGAIPQVFDPSNNDWSKEYTELKEILTEDEYNAARRSTMNAHYTSPTVISAIYDGLANSGFESGKILEPAMGIGNFFGAMPEAMRESELHGVELDSLTGRIARQLYPSADIQIKGFEGTKFENNSFDAVVGNVPFGDYSVNDKDYNKHKFLIHDYFIAKSIDKLRPGGVLAVVTSKGTMDKENSEMRKYIAQRAELLGAVRLPNDAFKKNAGTEVTSDILFFQKRERPIEINPDDVEWLKKGTTPDGLSVNNYFIQHPEMVLGRIVEGNKLYGTQQGNTSCVPIPGANLKEQLAEAVKNIHGTYIPRAKTAEKKKETEDIIPAPADSRKFSLYAVDGSVYYRGADETMSKVKLSADSLKRALAMIEIRDNVRELLDLQLNNADGSLDGDISECREKLNERYDDFVKKYGHFDDKKNVRVFKGDDGYNLLKALENNTDGTYEKADIFFHDTIKPNIIVTHVETAEEALILSIAEKAKIDFDYMTDLCGMDKETLVRELEGQIFRLPQKEEKYVTADEYLTGNIRTKLRELDNAPDGMDVSRHREALEAAMPKRVEAKDISVKLGAHWVAPEYIRQFIKETFKPGWRSKLEVFYSKASGKWKIDGLTKGDKDGYTASHIFGTKRKNAYEIIEDILNHSSMVIKDVKTDENGNEITDKNGRPVKVTNYEETKAVQSVARKIESAWQDWIFKDPDRREALVEKYNEIFNSIRHREYDGSHLSFVGMNTAITLKEHQKNAVARALYGGNTLLAHAVGGGKTFEMITIAMEGKRLGLHNKSLFAVPNALTEQVGRDFKKLYPAANILVATKKDFELKNRRQFFAKIVTGDWDAVIVGHSQFDRMALSKERSERYLQEELDRLREELEGARKEGSEKSFSVKEIEKTITRYEQKLKKEQERIVKDDFVDFEQMGFDKLFVDECHMYKNLATATKMSNVAGIGTTGSAKSAELLMKSKYFDEITGGRGQVYASGTPVSNSMTELYTMMRYLQADLLKECGIDHFDEWAADFGEVKTDYELKPESDGKYQLKTRFAQFNNLPELMGMFKECADIRTADTLDIEKPAAHVHEVVAEPSKIQKRLIKSLSKRASKIREGSVDPKDDNMLVITNDGRKIGLDQRLMLPGCPDDPNSKINMCVRNVFDIYERTAEKRSTQVIFCDMSTPKQENRQDRFEVYRPNLENGFDCTRRKIGLGKPGNKSYLGTFDDLKKYMDKTATDIEDKLQEGDIAVFRVPSEDGTKIESRAAVFTDGEFSATNSEDLLEKLAMSPIEDMPPKEFNVYDDIKDKLISMGVPEKEIAFIHDYDTAEKKQELFNQMNAGNVRILLGSTAKCGAGMNAQEKMIALHHLDAPLRPSDMEQRNGRIERQGNENKDVDIFRYVTDKSFDAYLYQILENKQKFISQVMTSKTPERVCADIDEQALDYAEVKALCAGNPLIREEMELQGKIKDLKMEKSRYNEGIYELQDNIRVKIPESIGNLEKRVKGYSADLNTARNAPTVTNDDGKEIYPIKIGNTVYTDRKSGGEALKAAIGSNIGRITEGKTVVIGEYRGLKLSLLYDTLSKTAKACLEGQKHHYCELNVTSDVGNIIRLDNCINNMEKDIQRANDKISQLKSELEQMKKDVEIPFSKADELMQAETRLEEVHTELTRFELTDDSAQKDLFERLADLFPEIMQGDKSHITLKTDSESFMPLSVEINSDILTIEHTYIQNGDLMSDPRIDFKVDYENQRVIPVSFENSGMGAYQTFDINNSTPEMMKKINDVLSFSDDWLDNIEQQGYMPVEEKTEVSISKSGIGR